MMGRLPPVCTKFCRCCHRLANKSSACRDGISHADSQRE